MTTADAPTNAMELRARADHLARAVPWFHSIALFPDLVTPGAKTPETLAAERACILGVLDLRARSVLDVGAWNGFYSFEAKRAGAGRVIASDSFTWRHPGFRGRETIELARECLQLDVETYEIDPVDLPGELEPVDVVLFLGVFYHLIDPIAGLRSVAALARDVLVVETELDLRDWRRPGMSFFPRGEMANDITNWWAPNAACLAALLEVFGFNYVTYQHYPPPICSRRGILHAFRSVEVACRYLTRFPDDAGFFDLRSQAGQAAVFGAYDFPEQAAAVAQAARERDESLDRLAAAERHREEALAAAAQLRRERDHFQARIAAIETSRSWRITAPMRRLLERVRR